MFEIGEHIVYGTSGICRVEEICSSPYDKNDTRTFYLLIPVHNPMGSTIYTPVDNDRVPMRRLMTREEIDTLIDAIPGIDLVQVPAEKQRREIYRNTVFALRPEGYVSVMKTVDRRREELFREYEATRNVYGTNDGFQMRSLSDYDELKRRNEIRHSTKSAYVTRRLPQETNGRSNGESAFVYFTQKIRENALYLLDEPENSLSATLQARLSEFLADSARFYNCQFIISTHSPFLLSMKGAKIYDLDAAPAAVRKWSDLENVRAYFELFEGRREEFDA
jgi:predicted ATPase